MKNLLLGLALASLLIVSTGCANGPIRNWLRGSACNTCTPPIGQPPNLGSANCNDCATGSGIGTPIMNPNQIPGGGTPYYADPALNSGVGTINSEIPMGNYAPNYQAPDYGTPQMGQPGIPIVQPEINYEQPSMNYGTIPPSGTIPSSEVYGGGIIDNQASPPSIGPN